MTRLRVIYVASLVILGVVLVFTVFRPMVQGNKYSEVTNESIIRMKDEWIIEFDILNEEGEDTTYTIIWSSGGEVYNRTSASLRPGRTYTHIHHIYPDTAKEGKVGLAIYKKGEATPFELATYYIRFD